MAEELPGLAQRVCQTKGEEKEAAKKELADYLEHFKGNIWSESGHCFPSGFLGAKKEGAIVWDKYVDSIEAFAQKVLNEELPNGDWSEEITKIDMKSHEITQKAEYCLDQIFY